MFELDAAVREWRLTFGSSLRQQDLNELEEHLRTQVDVLVSTTELSQEEAFVLARRRIGGSSELESEFTKVHGRTGWTGIGQWTALVFLGLMVLAMGLELVPVVGSGRPGEPAAPTILAAQVLVLLTGLAAMAWLFSALVRARHQSGRRFVLLALVLALGIVLTGSGVVLVALIGQYGLATLAGRGLSNFRTYVGTAVVLGILSLGLFLSVYLSERRRRSAEDVLASPSS